MYDNTPSDRSVISNKFGSHVMCPQDMPGQPSPSDRLGYEMPIHDKEVSWQDLTPGGLAKKHSKNSNEVGQDSLR